MVTRSLFNSTARRNWAQTVAHAETLVQPDKPDPNHKDIRNLAQNHLAHLTQNLRHLVESEHPMLTTMGQYYFEPNAGKHFRPLVVLLMSLATSLAPKQVRGNAAASGPPLPHPRESPAADQTYRIGEADSAGCTILPSQRRLSEIVELMHTATLLHDDVVDEAAMRRQKTCAHLQFGNKMAILVGDFLIARACCALTRLRHNEVTELLATVISDLTEGEVMQLKNSEQEEVVDRRLDGPTPATFNYYLQKSYLKTAALIAKSCRAAALLGGCPPEVADQAYLYGKNLGLAFQLIDDMLDFTVTEADMGKPVGADLKLGLATGPVLYAWQEYPTILGPLIRRKFSQPGDTQLAWDYIHRSRGLSQTYELARSHCDAAVAALMHLPESPARQALVDLTTKVLDRKK
ncbi:isoprenoid synthase domain-containing protein [Dimargaris cristalligena]|uniref:Isoprenoid synthase domain-containing protein n=1 Tax=Dimargaris cristalligena TaxID=215637 RepID=A0A4P9ZZX0_9FUNG|nr:isoprenoid synthase domain-containing protein [Dimargaris cristalligena]|eukprot:RKP39293.1 isoprenoid synthase domain-containing protein [Dimargaris cristalligena]